MLLTLASHNSLGGNSRNLVVSDLGCSWLVVVQGLGFPGASSHWKGTEAKVCIGVVGNPGGPFGLLGSKNKESLGIGVGSEPIAFENFPFLCLKDHAGVILSRKYQMPIWYSEFLVRIIR